MSDHEIPSPELLRKLLRYEPETGKLYWLPRPAEMFEPGRQTSAHVARRWNNRYAGKEAMTYAGSGYPTGSLFDRPYRAHRVIWAMQTGKWPEAEIDHINNNPSDNRWQNLRSASRLQNARNITSRASSNSKFLGVCWDKSRKKWAVYIGAHAIQRNLGRFDCEIEAAKAYDAAATKLYGEFANLNFPPLDGQGKAQHNIYAIR